jgi:PAS domain S-box-containing protein
MDSNQNSTPHYDTSLFFEISEDLLVISGYDGYLRKVNSAVLKTLGYTEEELLASPVQDFIHPDDRSSTTQKRDGLREGKSLLNFENRYLTKNGEIVWLSWTSIPVESSDFIYAFATNITHKKTVEEERNMLLSNMTQNIADLKNLNYRTAHDLRTPVNNLLALIGLINPEKIRDEETRNLMEMVKFSVEDLKATLNSQMDQITTDGSIQIPLKKLYFSIMMEKVSKAIGSLILVEGASVVTEFSHAPSVVFNELYLESIFLNLISNSIKYSRENMPAVITITSSQLEKGVQLVFQDNGQGFDLEKVKDKIFGFSQKFHDHSESRGIGLYLVYTHMTSLGGKLVLESEPGNGARFIITFPNR